MKFLLAGNWIAQIYEQACADALSKLGVDVVRFAWKDYFEGWAGRLQEKFPVISPALLRLNRDFLIAVKEAKPDVVLVWRGAHVIPSTIRRLKLETNATLVSYNNDDPFGPRADVRVPWHHKILWRNYEQCLPEYDFNFVYRLVNVAEVIAASGKNAHLLMPYFIPAIHRPMTLTETEQRTFNCDVVFVGHYEPDGRENYLRLLVKNGLRVRLFGGKYWTRKVLGELADYFGPVHTVVGEKYTAALCGAKICLNFLSRLNRDTYTRRCFEIPACGRLLLSERTKDLQGFFKENEEAVFFSNPAELVEKALWLKRNPNEIERIALAGMRRVHADGHSVDERMRQFLAIINGNSSLAV